MPKKKNRGGGTEYCQGYVDAHGQWNNGFHCPKWGGPDQKYCCGTDTHRYCCPKDESLEKLNNAPTEHIPLVIGLVVGCVVLFITMTFIICYFCRCCWAYKRRKRMQHGNANCAQHPLVTGQMRYAVNYSVCPHQSLYPEFMHMRPAPSYPMDDPPPYPGDAPMALEDKQPLRRSEIFPPVDDDDERSMQLSDASDCVVFNENAYHYDDSQPSTSAGALGTGSLGRPRKLEYAAVDSDYSPGGRGSDTDSQTPVLFCDRDSPKASDSLVGPDAFSSTDRSS